MSRRRRRNPESGLNWEKIALYGGLAVVAYLLYQKFIAGASAVLQAPAAAGNAAGGWLYQLLNPAGQSASQVTPSTGAPPAPGSVTTPGVYFYNAVFPDGSRHAIDAASVGSDSQFSYNGATYTLAIGIGANAAYLSSTVLNG